MKILYTGKQEHLHPNQKESLNAKFAKISKLLEVDGKADKQARVILDQVKNHHRAEVTLNYLDHGLVGEHTDPDQFTALNMALEKLERQMLKVRDRRRDIKKGPREGWDKGAAANSVIAAEPGPLGLPAAAPVGNGRPRILPILPDGKPMTAEEAVIEIGDDPYFVYTNAATNRPAVLLRRDDGDFELVEC